MTVEVIVTMTVGVTVGVTGGVTVGVTVEDVVAYEGLVVALRGAALQLALGAAHHAVGPQIAIRCETVGGTDCPNHVHEGDHREIRVHVLGVHRTVQTLRARRSLVG